MARSPRRARRRCALSATGGCAERRVGHGDGSSASRISRPCARVSVRQLAGRRRSCRRRRIVAASPAGASRTPWAEAYGSPPTMCLAAGTVVSRSHAGSWPRCRARGAARSAMTTDEGRWTAPQWSPPVARGSALRYDGVDDAARRSRVGRWRCGRARRSVTSVPTVVRTSFEGSRRVAPGDDARAPSTELRRGTERAASGDLARSPRARRRRRSARAALLPGSTTSRRRDGRPTMLT